MRILQVIDRLNIGGAEKVLVNLANMLHDKKKSVAVLVFESGFPLEAQLNASIPFYTLDRRNKYALSKLLKLNRYCRRYDIVHVHMRHCHAYVRLAQLLFGGKYKIVFQDHYGDIENDRDIPWHLRGLFRPQYYIGVSRTLTHWAKTTLRLPDRRVFLLSNTILPDKSDVYRSRHSGKRILIVSNIRTTKNILFAVRLLKALGLSGDVYGNIGDKLYYDEVLKEIGDADIRIIEGVTAFKGLYGQYTMALHCATSETGPLVLLEYMAYGIPFVAYKTGEVAAQIADELPECFADTFNVNEWAKQMDEASRVQDLAERLQFLFNKYFAPEKYIQQCLEIYKSVSC